MEALQFESKTKTLKLAKCPIPKINHPQEVLVKVIYSGVCGTDLHIIQGEFPCNESKPLILGHEFCGTIVDFGSSVDNLELGELVAVDPNSGCNRCHNCHLKNPHFCKIGGLYANLGVKNHGGWAEYCICHAEQIHKIPETVSPEKAALAEPLSCLMHGWDIVFPMQFWNNILITGAGIIGTLWVATLHARGYRRVTVVEINPNRLKFLQKLETNFRIITPADLKQLDETFDVAIDCSGACPAIEMGMAKLDNGGKLCMFGVAPPHAKITVSPFDVFFKELSILSVLVNPFSFPKAIGLIESMGDRYLGYEKLGVRIFKLNQYEEALALLKTGQITKAMFKIS